MSLFKWFKNKRDCWKGWHEWREITGVVGDWPFRMKKCKHCGRVEVMKDWEQFEDL